MSTLYLVDDHVIVREGMRALFEAAGFDVVGEAGDVAIAAADIARLVPDVVLLDLLLGEHSGMDLLRVLQQNKSRSRVIVQTMAEQARYISEAVKLGAAGYVLKGSDGAEVVRAIHDVLEGRRHFSGPVAERLVDSMGAPQHPSTPTRWRPCRHVSARSWNWWYGATPVPRSAPASPCLPRPSIPIAVA